jgi:hypothetical protein
VKPLSLQYAEQKLRDALDDGDLAACDHFSELVDMLTDMHERAPATLADAALWYASIGLHVFPLSAGSKIPRRGSHGLDDATSGMRQVAQWWHADPTANIGIATGHVVDVLDIDGEAGELSLARFIAAAEPEHVDVTTATSKLLRDVVGIVSTPRPGGRHFYFPARGMTNGAKLWDGVDVRGLGGYVVAPPSVTDVGSYSWTRTLDLRALLVSSTS